MPYIAIENFKYGRDSRRSELTSQPGTLLIADNGHINQGAEFEKRKAFLKVADLSAIVDTYNDPGTFGFEDTATGMVVFGSANPYGGSAPALSAAMPSAVTYVQLVHPAVTGGVAYDRTKHRMTRVISTSYGGSSWAVATFVDGLSFAYYNGTVIQEFIDGVVFDGLTTPSAIAAQAAASLTAALGAGYTAVATGAYVDLKAPIGGSFSIDATDTSTNGSIGREHISDGSDGTTGTGASVNVTLTAGTTGSVSSITAPDGNGGTVELLGSAVAYSASLANTAGLITNMINATVTSPKYTASWSGGASQTITISAPSSLGATVNGLDVVVTFSGDLAFDSSGAIVLSVAANYTYANGDVVSTSAHGVVTTDPAATAGRIDVTPSGGTAPYTYKWQVLGATWTDCVAGDWPMSIDSASTKFYAVVPYNTVQSKQFRCKVTDSSGPTQTAYSPVITVSLSNTPPGGL